MGLVMAWSSQGRALVLLGLLCCLYPLLLHGNPAEETKTTVTPEAKLGQIAALLERNAHSGVITLDDTNYNYYAVSKPRPYHLVVFFTATASKYQCSRCREIEAEFSLVAESYADPSVAAHERNLFFIKVDFDNSNEVFRKYDFKGVPVIIYVPPDNVNSKAYQIDGKDRMSMHSTVDAEGIAKFIQGRNGVDIQIYRSPYGVIVIMLMLFGVLALFARLFINLLPTLLRKIQNRYIWMLASLGLYTCSISGLVFDIIRGPPPFYLDQRTGQIMFFHPQSGQQFVVEGFIIGGLNILCALSAVLLVEYSPKFKDHGSKQGFMVSCLVAFAFFFYQIFGFYRMKNRWYMRV